MFSKENLLRRHFIGSHPPPTIPTFTPAQEPAAERAPRIEHSEVLASAARALEPALLFGLLGWVLAVHLSSAPLDVGELHSLALLS